MEQAGFFSYLVRNGLINMLRAYLQYLTDNLKITHTCLFAVKIFLSKGRGVEHENHVEGRSHRSLTVGSVHSGTAGSSQN